jgi:hypothetical protein
LRFVGGDTVKNEEDIERLSNTDQDCLDRIVELLFEKNVPNTKYSDIVDFFYVKSRTILFGNPSFAVPYTVSNASERKVITTKKSDFPMPLLKKSLNSLLLNDFITIDGDGTYELSEEFADLAYAMHNSHKHLNKIQADSNESIPASDRFVSTSDNSLQIQDAVEKLVELEDRVGASNEFDADNEQRAAIKQEVGNIRSILSGSKVRTASISAVVTGSGILLWLAEHASDAMLNSLASQTIAILSKVFGLNAN